MINGGDVPAVNRRGRNLYHVCGTHPQMATLPHTPHYYFPPQRKKGKKRRKKWGCWPYTWYDERRVTGQWWWRQLSVTRERRSRWRKPPLDAAGGGSGDGGCQRCGGCIICNLDERVLVPSGHGIVMVVKACCLWVVMRFIIERSEGRKGLQLHRAQSPPPHSFFFFFWPKAPLKFRVLCPFGCAHLKFSVFLTCPLASSPLPHLDFCFLSLYPRYSFQLTLTDFD